MEKPKKTLQEAAHSENRRLRTDPNVVGVGYGLRLKGGKPQFEVCLQYYVKEKLADRKKIEARGSKPVPVGAHGYKTDVVQLEVMRRTQCPEDKGMPTGDRSGRKENPILGGTSTTVLSDWHSFPTGFGTLGGICFDAAGGGAMALSNAHVWGTDAGQDVIQPWLPTAEYLEAVVKLITCGPLLSYIFDTTVPSPLTAGLSAAAAAAWIAAAASDAEDPSRWGQRNTPPGPAGSTTRRETIRLVAPLPQMPFAGRDYRTKATWDYTRETTAGDHHIATTENRANEHLLVGKRVWTERDVYSSGQTVRLCAEVVSDRARTAEDYFVVANCYPKGNPDRLLRRVLVPGSCKTKPEKKEVCFRGFPLPAEPGEVAFFPIRVGVFALDSLKPGKYVGPWPSGDPAGITILQLPSSPVRLTFPPATHVRVHLIHRSSRLSAKAFNSAGLPVDAATIQGEGSAVQVLELKGPEIVEVVISGAEEKTYLVGACISWEERQADGKKLRRFAYHGTLELGLHEAPDRWGIVLSVQTVDNSPPGSDPVAAAGILGGITASANVVQVVGCTAVMLLDHVFDVI